MDKFDCYLSPYVERYCRKSPLLTILSQKRKISLWRQLWLWLAEAQNQMGIEVVTKDKVEQMRANMHLIDWQAALVEETRVKHDVMAHVHTFAMACPDAAGIIHLGATSCFVQDNADLIVQKECVDHLLMLSADCLQYMKRFASKNQNVVTVGRTHYMPASLVTVGKRSCLWIQEMLMAFEDLKLFRKTMLFRGIGGATGTQDSFLTLFGGDTDKVEQLNKLIMDKAGFEKCFPLIGQTYSRQQDVRLASALSAMGAAVKRICNDIRFLQMTGELSEPFETDQIGSSAMPYKTNPIKSERCCAFGRQLIACVSNALSVACDQGFERTLDDSCSRRIYIPQMFLLADALLTTFRVIFAGLQIYETNIKKSVEKELPFVLLEKAMMMLTTRGGDRQEIHAKIRSISLDHKGLQQQGKKDGGCVSTEAILSDTLFDDIREDLLTLAKNPLNFTGNCTKQVQDFIANDLEPVLAPYNNADQMVNGPVALDV